MGNRVTHISDTEATRDFGSLLERVRAGEEVVIEHEQKPVAVLAPATPAKSLAQLFQEIASEVPAEEWERVPKDLSKNLDHYLYGSHKVSS